MDVAFRVRQSRPNEDRLLARHFYRMWRDNGVPEEKLAGDWERRVLDFVEAARGAYRYCAFVAEQDGAGILGSAGCQIFGGLYPDILDPAVRRYGYLWGVYVEPNHRRRGIARLLTQTAIAHLTAIGCTHALLHASPPGRPVYEGLGFEPTNEMRLGLAR